MKHPPMRLALCIVFLFLFTLSPFAQVRERDPAKEEPVLQELRNIAPKTVETFKSATANLDNDRYDEAIREYNEVLKQAPNFEPALRRLGYSLVAVGKRAEGIASAQKALDLHRSPDNLLGLAAALVSTDADGKYVPTESEQRQALSLASESSRLGGDGDPDALSMIAQLSLFLNRMDSFRDATKKLSERFPELPQTHYFQGIELADEGKFDDAVAEIKKAESGGLSPAESERILGAIEKAKDESMYGLGGYINYLYILGGVVAVWAVGLLLLFIAGKVLSIKTLHAIENSNPNDITGGGQAGLRRFYRKVITIAGIYYYVSQPFVVVLVVAVTAGVVLGFLIIGWLPIKLLLILGFVGAASIFYMVKSLFVRPKVEDPGRALSEAEAPGLWLLAREVADALATRPVDEIRITAGIDLAVYERGSWRAKIQEKAERILIIGVANLNDFRINAFRAVLAHEYGHFSNRDTAGGDVAFRVNTDMMRLAESIVRSGTNSIYNLAFHFIRLYHFLFRRITHGATRLQETLADRVAAYHFGSEAFREGLTHVIRREVEFTYLATKEIDNALSANRPFNNLYDLSPSDESAIKDIDDRFKEAMNRLTTADDTHPSPNDRFRLIENVVTKESSKSQIDGLVWDLFANRQALTDEMNNDLKERANEAKYN